MFSFNTQLSKVTKATAAFASKKKSFQNLIASVFSTDLLKIVMDSEVADLFFKICLITLCSESVKQ